MIWAALLVVLLIAGVLYWLLVLSEGAYLGRRVVTALYDWEASRYDPIKQVQPQDDALHLARPLVEALHGVAAPLVLDVATGTGRLPLSLLRQLDFEGRIVGLDLSRRMLAIAQHKTRHVQHRVGLVRQDAMKLPFPDRTFHAVTCLEALEFFPRPTVALAEMVRVLHPGGQLLISNRVSVDAFFLPGRAFRPQALHTRLQSLGLVQIKPRRWQVHYDLITAQKPGVQPQPGMPSQGGTGKGDHV